MRFPEYPGRFEYRRCNGFGLVFNSLRLKDMSQLYGGAYFYSWKSAAFTRQRVLEQVQRLIRPGGPLLKGNRVLEVGSARGHFLHVLRQMGFRGTGAPSYRLETSPAETQKTNAIVVDRDRSNVPLQAVSTRFSGGLPEKDKATNAIKALTRGELQGVTD